MSGFFQLKKIVSRLFLTLTLVWCLIGAVLIFPRYGGWILGGVLLLMAIGGSVGQTILNRLSRKYPQFSEVQLPEGRCLVAVAGSGFQRHSSRVPESWFGDNFVIRLTEAGRAARMLQDGGREFQLLISMPEHPELHEEKLVGVRAFLSRFGIPAESIEIVESVLDSEDEMIAFGQDGVPVIIVSNSWHVPRLMLLARHLGIPAIPAPAGQLFSLPRLRGISGILPTAGNLQMLECGLHELAGIIQIFLKYRWLKYLKSPSRYFKIVE